MLREKGFIVNFHDSYTNFLKKEKKEKSMMTASLQLIYPRHRW